MCTHFSPTRNGSWTRATLGVDLPSQPCPPETYPGYAAPIALKDGQGGVQCTLARFGLIPHWTQDTQAATQIGRKTYNARTETVAEKPSYRTPWRQRRFAIALLDDFFEPSWETGRAVRWRIQRADGQPMGVASIWDRWTDTDTGEIVTSFSMLTVNADGHPVMGRFHRPGDEKRSVVVLPPEQFQIWLSADVNEAMQMCAVPAGGTLTAEPAPQARPRAVQNLPKTAPAAPAAEAPGATPTTHNSSQPSLF
ncbi:SOS response-associated peptidase [Aquabacterium sp. A08]|uniref:SOS response-associated peptidase n=1 Tax=Aquabacterium sp. A08 TaxID=2718532 RepID=UPI001420B5D0|nr:SOS response-associated peptidase family protein [Aquabacterium sp. A08]NIC41282.1 SOS response-associated peptidase [Aquabacterium sp. A08]